MKKMHHIQCTAEDIGGYILLPGDPGRVPLIASYLEEAVLIASNREYTTYSGYLGGVKVSVTSTGIGGPSAAIALEELVKLGAHTFIRIGTCGGIDSELIPGTLILPTGAIRKDGTANEYIPIEFPAVPNFKILSSLTQTATALSYNHALGIVECKDSYYGQHEPERMPIAPTLQQKWEAWKCGGALASEMESSTLFILSSILRVRCATVLLLCRNKERELKYHTETVSVTDISPAINTAITALKRLIQEDKNTLF